MGRTPLRTFAIVLFVIALTATTRPALADDRSLCDPSITNCRTMVVANNCDQTVWLAALGNAVTCSLDADCPTATSSCHTLAHVCRCNTDTDCATGTQVCDTAASPARCAYDQSMAGGTVLASDTSETTYVPSHSPGENAATQ